MLSYSPVETMEVAVTPSGDMLLFVTLGLGLFLSLFVAIMASLEVFHISGSSRGDPDLSHGLQIRRWFMATIALSNGARVVCSLLNEIYAYSCEVMNVGMKDMVLVHWRCALPCCISRCTRFSLCISPSYRIQSRACRSFMYGIPGL